MKNVLLSNPDQPGPNVLKLECCHSQNQKITEHCEEPGKRRSRNCNQSDVVHFDRLFDLRRRGYPKRIAIHVAIQARYLNKTIFIYYKSNITQDTIIFI